LKLPIAWLLSRNEKANDKAPDLAEDGEESIQEGNWIGAVASPGLAQAVGVLAVAARAAAPETARLAVGALGAGAADQRGEEQRGGAQLEGTRDLDRSFRDLGVMRDVAGKDHQRAPLDRNHLVPVHKGGLRIVVQKDRPDLVFDGRPFVLGDQAVPMHRRGLVHGSQKDRDRRAIIVVRKRTRRKGRLLIPQAMDNVGVEPRKPGDVTPLPGDPLRGLFGAGGGGVQVVTGVLMAAAVLGTADDPVHLRR